jgi:hypothetical protein
VDMAAGEVTSGWSAEVIRPRSNTHFQAIDAHYYNITDAESRPIAGLLVLLDGSRHPVRTELHLYEDLPSHVQEAAVRQSRLVLQERYVGDEPVPLRILSTVQQREAMNVHLPQAEASVSRRPRRQNSPVMLGMIGALLVVVLLVWGAIAYFGSAGQGNQTASDERAPAEAPVVPVAAGRGTSIGEAPGIDTTVAVNNENLPISQNARADLSIGMRVKIVPGLQLWLRSEPGATEGEEVGFMAEGQEAVIRGGPRMTQGESDTIVWWYVQLDDGTEAWAAANTSQYTLLVPASE